MEIFGVKADLIVQISTLIISLVSAIAIATRKARLHAFITHSAKHIIPGSSEFIHTHAAVIRNTGSASAVNVHVLHDHFPDSVSITVYPPISYIRNNFPSGGGELVFERLVPGHQVTISYLYPPHIIWSQINLSAIFNDGYARVYPVDFIRVFPQWFNRIVGVLIVIGFVFVVYWTLKFLIHFIPFFNWAWSQSFLSI